MDITGESLLDKLINFQIGASDDELSFTNRLARENNWSKRFANKCVDEYKRYIYLMSHSKNPLTPSYQVEQAWHLHLTYTHSYWNDLCRDTLTQELHHKHIKSEGDDSKKFKEQYQKTLELYKDSFGEAPPEDIWPNVNERFENANEFIRINNSENLLFPKFFSPLFSSQIFQFFFKLAFGLLKIILLIIMFFGSAITAFFLAPNYLAKTTQIPEDYLLVGCGLLWILCFLTYGRNNGSTSSSSGSGGGGSGCGGCGGGCGGGGC